jgi:hypothetical protein
MYVDVHGRQTCRELRKDLLSGLHEHAMTTRGPTGSAGRRSATSRHIGRRQRWTTSAIGSGACKTSPTTSASHPELSTTGDAAASDPAPAGSVDTCATRSRTFGHGSPLKAARSGRSIRCPARPHRSGRSARSPTPSCRTALGPPALISATATASSALPATRIRDLAERWYGDIQQNVTDGTKAPNTARLYRHYLDRHILPGIGALRLGEATVPRLDKVITAVRDRSGTAAAKACRSALSGMLGHAARHGAVAHWRS